MKLLNDCPKRILLAYANGSLHSHVILPVIFYIIDKTGYSTNSGQFIKITTRELAKQLKSSKTSISEALQDLIDLGIIYKSKYGYALIENMAYRGSQKHQQQLMATRIKIMQESNPTSDNP